MAVTPTITQLANKPDMYSCSGKRSGSDTTTLNAGPHSAAVLLLLRGCWWALVCSPSGRSASSKHVRTQDADASSLKQASCVRSQQLWLSPRAPIDGDDDDDDELVAFAWAGSAASEAAAAAAAAAAVELPSPKQPRVNSVSVFCSLYFLSVIRAASVALKKNPPTDDALLRRRPPGDVALLTSPVSPPPSSSTASDLRSSMEGDKLRG